MPRSASFRARRGREGRSAATPSRLLVLLDSFPIYRRVLQLAVAHEESGLHSPKYLGWRWNDVELHPTRLIRLVTNGITRINLRTRKATYYLLNDRAETKRALERNSAEVKSGAFEDPEAPRRSNKPTIEERV
ncbi:MAG TPA: hypothetical protein VGS11_02595 [Candidatus Bathyarchaeia archaeon]|nr:hypothetical protein [Candidatus Bathyarchaeia archaeon]